jgi:hypothetical protein
VLALAGPALAAPPCGDQVLVDWWNDGRVDRVYPLHCYEEAIDRMPSDIRDYTNAADIIERALQSAARKQPGPAPQPVAADAPQSLRWPLALGLAGGALLLLAAAGIGYLGRRRGPGRTSPRR